MFVRIFQSSVKTCRHYKDKVIQTGFFDNHLVVSDVAKTIPKLYEKEN